MGTYKEWIELLKNEFIGKRVDYNGNHHTIVDVDYNGFIHIDLPSQFNKTTAVFEPGEARKALI